MFLTHSVQQHGWHNLSIAESAFRFGVNQFLPPLRRLLQRPVKLEIDVNE